MAELASDVEASRTARTAPLDPPPRLAELRAQDPVAPMRFPDGHVGWLVTSHEVARDVLVDPRFSSHNTMRRPVIPLPVADEDGLRPMVPGAFVRMDPPEHSRFRRPLAGHFTARKMRRFEPRIRQIVRGRLRAMAQAGPPVDLVQMWGLPIASLVMCELLGVPYQDQERFQRDATTLVRLEASPREAESARLSLVGYLTGLVRSKRVNPVDDIFSELAAAGDLTDEEIPGWAFCCSSRGMR